jgi:hypothetical protein
MVACSRRFEDRVPDGLGSKVLDTLERLPDTLSPDTLPSEFLYNGREALDAAARQALADLGDEVVRVTEAFPPLLSPDFSDSIRMARNATYLIEECYRNFGRCHLHCRRPLTLFARDVWRMAGGVQAEERYQAGIAFDLFHLRRLAVHVDPAWRTSTAVTLAVHIYETRDFSVMPILADALQDAGCDSDDILGHCRGPGPHVRGCWVVDLVLGKM